MISAGDTRTFSISAEITHTPPGWILGRFRFVLHGKVCGDWDDTTVLNGCHSWLKDFVENSRPRFEPELLELSSNDVFERLVKPVILDEIDEIAPPEIYERTFSRFHIAYLGMSSFDDIVMVLIEAPELQRRVWQVGKHGEIHVNVFPPRHMQMVANEFCTLFEEEVTARGLTLS